VLDFVTKLSRTGTTKCVLKPNQSAGSDSIHLCETNEQAVAAFHAVHGQINGLGQINDGVLCQEYLAGTEYVVDGVSRDGVYKVLAIWEYDKRSVNGANFVYFGMTLRDASDPRIRAVVEYAREVVKGLKIHQGASHMEIICDTHHTVGSDGLSGHRQISPCLVEVGMRCHGGEATWLPVAMECIGKPSRTPCVYTPAEKIYIWELLKLHPPCVSDKSALLLTPHYCSSSLRSPPSLTSGYSQLDATLNCYLRPDRFDALPFEPVLHKQGSEAFLVSMEQGTLKDIPGMDTIRGLASFRYAPHLPRRAVDPTLAYCPHQQDTQTLFCVSVAADAWRCSRSRARRCCPQWTALRGPAACSWSTIARSSCWPTTIPSAAWRRALSSRLCKDGCAAVLRGGGGRGA
jgi:hypothetical protein